MPTVALLGLEQCYSSSLIGVMDILQIANNAQCHLGDDFEPFECVLLTSDGKPLTCASGTPLTPTSSINDGKIYDAIYIPGIPYNDDQYIDQWLAKQDPIRQWLVTQWQQGCLLMSICTGTFLIASTQLLDEREATTTWWLESSFKQRFPNVNLNIKQMITEQERLICAGAITSYQQLTLRLIERFFSPRISSFCAKTLLIDIGQNLQAPYTSLAGTHDHSDELVKRAQAYLQEHMAEKITMDQLADQLHVSQRTLIRHCKQALGIKPSSYLQNLRLEAAKQLLETTNMSIESIIYRVGYSDTSSFTRLFSSKTSLTPTAYRERLRHLI